MPMLLALVNSASVVSLGPLLVWRRHQRVPVRQHPTQIVFILLTWPLVYALSYPLWSGDFTQFSSDVARSHSLLVFLMLLDFGLQLALETQRLKRQRQGHLLGTW